MKDEAKTREQLLDELDELRRRIAELEGINDQKRGEEELRRSQATLRATIESLPFDFFAIGPDGRYVMQNAVLRANWGQLVGKSPEEVCPDENTRSLWLDNNRRAFAGEKVEEDVTLTVQGEKRFYHNVVVPIIDEGQIRGILGMNVDITDRKRAEEALQRAHDELEEKVKERTAELTTANDELRCEVEERKRAEQELAVFQQFAEASGRGFGMIDLTGCIVYVNPAFCRMLDEEKPGDVVGKRASAWHPQGYERQFEEEIKPALIQGRHWEGEQILLTSQGRAIPTLYNVFLIQDERGQPYRLGAAILDLTERKRAEEALRQSEERYRTLVEASPDALLMSDLEGHVTFASQRAAELHRCKSVDELIGRNPLEFIAPEDHPRFLANLQQTLKEGISRDVEYKFVRKDGTQYSGEVSGAVVKDVTGKPIALMALVRDITERQAAEEALRQSFEELRAVYDGMFEGLLILDGETKRLVRVNSSLCRMLGYAEEELLSMSVTDIHPPDDVASTLARIQARADGRFQEDANVPFLRKDGSVFYADIMGNTLTYGGRPCILGLFRDITERKQVAEALAESEAKYRHLVETTDTGYLILDASGRVVDANDEYVRISGHHALEAILGRSVVEWTAPYDVDRNAKEVEKCVERGHVRELEIDYARPDGTVTPVEINASCIDTKQGRRILSLCRDISERRQTHEALVRERRTLKHMLRASDHERQLIAYDIHDGLAQQLAGAIMQLQTYGHLKRTRPKAAAKAFDAGMTMLRQGHSEARRLISGVRPPILDESGVVAAIAHLVNDQGVKGGPHIVFHSGVEFTRLTPILENVIYRIVQEGLTNASKHSQSEMVRLNLRQRGNKVRIEIRDWGQGFDPKTVPADRFGLAGIRERARLLGGKCRIQSKPGTGTTILVELPIAEREAEEWDGS